MILAAGNVTKNKKKYSPLLDPDIQDFATENVTKIHKKFKKILLPYFTQKLNILATENVTKNKKKTIFPYQTQIFKILPMKMSPKT